MKKKQLLKFIAILFIVSCSKTNPGIPIHHLGDINEIEKFTIKDWAISDAFYLRPDLKSLNAVKYDPFYSLNESEDLLPANKILKYSRKINNDSTFYKTRLPFKTYSNEYGIIDLSNKLKKDKVGFVYLTAKIHSETAQDVVFMVGGDDDLKITINGQKHEVKYVWFDPYGAIQYSKYIFVKLNKGVNTVILKSTNFIKSWASETYVENWRNIIHICSPDRYNTFYLTKEKKILSRSVIPLGYKLEMKNLFHPKDSLKSISIKNHSSKELTTVKFVNNSLPEKVDINSFMSGMYELNIKSKYTNYSQKFYYGDIHQGIKKQISLCKRVINRSLETNVVNSAEALYTRYNLLNAHYIVNSNYYAMTQQTKEGSIKVDSFSTAPIYTSKLNTPYKITLENFTSNSHQLDEIQFFTIDETGYKEILPDMLSAGFSNNEISLEDSVIYKKLFDKNNETDWDPSLNKPKLEFTFSENKPNYIQIIPNHTENLLSIEKRYLFIYDKLFSIYHDLIKGNNPFVNKPGIQVLSYTSPIEDKPRYYVSHAPENVDTSPRPLVIYLPLALDAHVPYLKGMALAYIDVREQVQYLTNRFGYLAIVPEARTFSQGHISTIAVNDLLVTIESAKKYYSIDTSRIFIISGCGGTDFALSLAAKFPGKFRAIGIANGVISNPVNNNWGQLNAPLNLIENLSNTPIKFIQGELDTHSPPESVQNFVTLAKEISINSFTLNLIKGQTTEALSFAENREDLYSYFKQQQSASPQRIHFKTAYRKYNKSFWINCFPVKEGSMSSTIANIVNPGLIKIKSTNTEKVIIDFEKLQTNLNQDVTISINQKEHYYSNNLPEKDTFYINPKRDYIYQPPLMDVFAESFVVVEGAYGNKLENKLNRHIVNSLCNMWESEYYVPCKRTTDEFVSHYNIKNDNLILVGNQHSNAYIEYIYKAIPLKITDEEIRVGSEVYKGKELGFWFTYPNPLNPEKYIAIIGSNSKAIVPFRQGNPAIDGFYGYEIVDYSSNRKKIIKKGTLN